MPRTALTVALLLLALISPGVPADEAVEDGFSSPRRAAGLRVVRPRPGSLPFDGDWSALAALAVEREHYPWDARDLDAARRAAYVADDVDDGTPAGSAATARGWGRRAPLRSTTFNGLDRLTSGYLGFTAYPPDANLAVSRGRVIQATNVAIRMTTRQGQEIDRLPLNNFFGFDGTSLLFDPKVFYDRLSDRFFVVALEHKDIPRRSGIWIGVSRSPEPARLSAPDEFCTYRMSGNQGGSWADYPTIGVNEAWFSIAVNNFEFLTDVFKKAHIYVMPVDQITDNATGACPALGVRRFSPTTDDSGQRIFGYHPVQHYSRDVAGGSPLYVLSTAFLLPSNRYTLWRIATGPTGAPEISRQPLVGDFQYTFSPTAPQRGGVDLDTGDPRITQAAFRNGRIWFAHGTACSIGALPNEGCIRVVEIAPGGGAARIAFSETFGLPNTFLFWPGIAVNKDGDVLVVSMRGKAQQFLRTVYNGKRAGAPGFDALRSLGHGTCTLDNPTGDGSVNRTGDYVGLQTDPLDDLSFWFTGEAPGAIGNGFGCDWKTRIARTRYPDP